MTVAIEQAQSKKALREFIYWPARLYRDDCRWSPPMWMEERQNFSTKNPILSHSDYAMFLARRGGRTAGRILAYVDHNFNDFYHSRIGMFGSFESIREPEVARALFSRAEQWLAARGMETIRGPINPVSECWGFLYSGFDSPAMFMTPYNPPFYNEYAEGCGYLKVKDLYAYEADARQGYNIPQRFIRFRERLLELRPQISVRRIDMKKLGAEAEAIWRISNEAIRNNWGWVPYDREELQAVLKKLKPIADPDAIWMVEDSGHPVGFSLGFPDLNACLRKTGGRLLPFGFITLFRELRKLRDYRLFGLAVLPEYHSLGLDVLLYVSLFEALAPRGVRLEANYVLEDNPKMINALQKLDLRLTKVYRVYEKALT